MSSNKIGTGSKLDAILSELVPSSNTKESRVHIVANPPRQALHELSSSRQIQIQTTHAMKSFVYLLWWLHADFHRLAEALTAKVDLFLMFMHGIIKLHIGWCECVGYGSWIGVTWGALRYSFKRWDLLVMQLKMKWSSLSEGSKIVFAVSTSLPVAWWESPPA